MEKEWVNWSGSLKSRPAAIEVPESEQDITKLIEKAVRENKKIRATGAGHSSIPLVETKDILLSLKHFNEVEAPDRKEQEATILAGTTIHDAGKDLEELGLAMHNTGDVDVQVLAGAINTGTHGTGKELKNLSTMLIGGRMITGTGDIVDFSEEDGDLLRALRVSLGTFGIFTALRVRLLPQFNLQRKEWCTHIDDCLEHLDELIGNNRNFDFYWYPRDYREWLEGKLGKTAH